MNWTYKQTGLYRIWHGCLAAAFLLLSTASVNATTETQRQLAPSKPSLIQSSKFYGDHSRGWHWYEDPQLKKEVEKDVMRSPTEMDPMEQLKKIQENVEKARVKAVLNPTHENVENYMRVQKEEMARAQKFADAWKRVLYANPDLDGSVDNPTTEMASLVKRELDAQEQKEAIDQAAEKYGVFFFFRGDCPYCHKFGPILKRFSTKYNVEVIPISLDGGTLPDWQNPKIQGSNVVASEFKVTTVPSVFLIDPENRNVVPLAQGLISMTDLEDRVANLGNPEIQEIYKDQPLWTKVNHQ